jgi:hypothetical protein
MTKAYVETTVLANALLKPGHKSHKLAHAALRNYDETELPVYAIKEFKAGILKNYCLVHDSLLSTKSIEKTLDLVHRMFARKYIQSTALEALRTAQHQVTSSPATPDSKYRNLDEEIADRYRLSLAVLIINSWKRRRRLTTSVVQELECYVELKPERTDSGLFDLEPLRCNADPECCLAKALRSSGEKMEKMRDSIPSASGRSEDQKRRDVLRHLSRTKRKLEENHCRALGDAVFAFFAPKDSVILTTNNRDLAPLAASLGKTVATP